jgi:hypothetical protein
MAIDKGKIVAIGTNSDISKQYESKKYNRWGWQVYLSRIN